MHKRAAVGMAAVLALAGAGFGLGETLSGSAPHVAARPMASGTTAYRQTSATAGGSVPSTTVPSTMVPSMTGEAPAVAASGGALTGNTATTTTPAPTVRPTSAGGTVASGGGGDTGQVVSPDSAPTPSAPPAAASTSPATTSQPAPVSGGVCGSGRGACAADTVTVGPTAASGGAVPLTATVRPASAATGGSTPSGYVLFSIDTGHGLQPAPCSQAPSGPRQGVISLDRSGTATCTVTLASGTYRIGALYVSSTGAYRGGASAPATVRVS